MQQTDSPTRRSEIRNGQGTEGDQSYDIHRTNCRSDSRTERQEGNLSGRTLRGSQGRTRSKVSRTVQTVGAWRKPYPRQRDPSLGRSPWCEDFRTVTEGITSNEYVTHLHIELTLNVTQLHLIRSRHANQNTTKPVVADPVPRTHCRTIGFSHAVAQRWRRLLSLSLWDRCAPTKCGREALC